MQTEKEYLDAWQKASTDRELEMFGTLNQASTRLFAAADQVTHEDWERGHIRRLMAHLLATNRYIVSALMKCNEQLGSIDKKDADLRAISMGKATVQ